MMRGYFDESGEHAPDGRLLRLSIGGFMAPLDAVHALCARWTEALRDEGLGNFHMTDIASDEERFMDWPRERQRRLERFVNILCESGVEFGAYSYAGQGRFGLFRELYQSGLARAYINFASFCERRGERGHIFFAKTGEISERLIGGYFERLRWDEFLDGYTVQLSRSNPALQAAEIVARGMKRLMQDGIITYSFARIVIEGRRAGKEFRSWPQDAFAAAQYLGHDIRLGLTRAEASG